MNSVILRLFTGPHMGAELVLEPGDYVLGSSLDCDIILNDSSVAPRHLILQVSASPPAVRVVPLDGDALVADEPLRANAELAPRTPCFVGLTCLAWAVSTDEHPATSETGSAGEPTLPDMRAGPDMRAAWDEVGRALRPILTPPSAAEPVEAERPAGKSSSPNTFGPDESETDRSGTAGNAAENELDENVVLKVNGSTANNAVLNRLPALSAQPTGRHLVRRSIIFALLLLALSGLVFKTHDELNKSNQSVEMIKSILSEAGFSSLDVTESDKGPLVSGRLPDDAERGRLVRLVQNLHYPVYLDVQVEQDLMQGLAASFHSRELYPMVWAERDGDDIRLHISGYIKDGVVEAWALAGAREDLPWLGAFLDEGTEPSPGKLIRSILHAEDIELVLRPALDAARLDKAKVTYLPGIIEISATFDVDARKRLDRVLTEVRERLGVPIDFQVREELPPLPQPVAGKATGMHTDKPTVSSPDAPASTALQSRSPSAFRVTGVTMTPMRFITLESGERVFEGGMLPGGHTLETISPTQLTLSRDGQMTTLTLRGSHE